MTSLISVAYSDAADITGFELETRPKDGLGMSGFVYGLNQIHLTVFQGTAKDGDEARIRVYVDPTTTLGDILTISWDVYVVKGYRPHVDIFLDITGDSIRDTCLTAEYAQANGDGVTSTLNTWLSTFEGGSGLYSPSWTSPTGTITDITTINGETAVWEQCLGTSYKLSAYQTPTGIASTRVTGEMINATTNVLYFEIEIDDWTILFPTADAESYVKNIELNSVDVLDTCLSSFVGPKGPTGPEGDRGSRGLTGSQGPTGLQGETGEDGIAGEAGSDGLQGPNGDAGSQGIQGVAGETGPPGATGDAGLQGVAGEAGSQGPKGETGDTGAVGQKGAEGEPAPVSVAYGGAALGSISVLGLLYMFFRSKP